MKQFSFKTFLNGYGFSILLLLSIIAGGFLGAWMGQDALILKPLGDIFLNLMFTVVVPLVFFCIASSVAAVNEFQRLAKIIMSMLGVFLFMGLIAAIYTLIVSVFFSLDKGLSTSSIGLEVLKNSTQMLIPTEHHLSQLLTVSDFPRLFLRENMLALIIFSFLLGCAVSATGEKSKPLLHFLQSGMAVFLKLTNIIMLYAPIGFFCFFTVLIGQWGNEFVGAYYRIGVIYYVATGFYFFIIFTCFVVLAKKDIRIFWKNIIAPSITSVATCSSAASLPVNLEATEKMGVAPEIYQTVIPLGTIIHKQGSIMGGIIKILFLFSLFHVPFAGSQTWILMIFTALLVGTVMGAIPSGGMLGEMLIVSIYGFPPQALMLIAVISLMIDPPATLLNVTGNSVASLLTERCLNFRKQKQ